MSQRITSSNAQQVSQFIPGANINMLKKIPVHISLKTQFFIPIKGDTIIQKSSKYR